MSQKHVGEQHHMNASHNKTLNICLEICVWCKNWPIITTAYYYYKYNEHAQFFFSKAGLYIYLIMSDHDWSLLLEIYYHTKVSFVWSTSDVGLPDD